MKWAHALLTVKSVNDDKRIILGTATTPAPDRVDDVVEPLGVKFKNPMPLLWHHDSRLPVGEVRFKKPTKAGIDFEARLPFVEEDGPLKDRVDTAWQEVKYGLVRGVSIGFRDLEFSRMENGGLRFIETEVLELSLVTIPANAEATIQTIKHYDAQKRAASGRTLLPAPSNPPGVSGPPRHKGNGTMKTTEQFIRELEDERATKAARIEEIAPDDAGKFADDEAKAEYRGLVAEVKQIDEKIADQEGILLARKTAKPIIAKDVKTGSQSRGGIIQASVKELPKGTAFARYAMAVAAGKGSFADTLEYAKRWDSQTPEVSAHIKATVGSIGNTTWGDELAEPQTLLTEFIELLMPKTVIGRINGFDRVPFNVRIIEMTNGSTVNWVAEAAAKPVSDPSFGDFTLGVNKIAGIVVISDELVRLSRPGVEEKVRNDLVKQIAKFMDEQFLDSSITQTSARPAAVTVGAQALNASDTDIEAWWADFNGAMAPFDESEIDTSSLHIVMTSSLARRLGTLRNSLGQLELPTLNPTGGTIMGYPVIVSNSAPSGQITFIVASEIAMADDGTTRLDASNQATLDLAGGNSPTFSLWQKNATALRAERWVTYKKKRANAVTMIESAAYGGETLATA